jgi:Rad52/22 family double-strand break repair protein
MAKVISPIAARVEVIGKPKESSYQLGQFYYPTLFIDLAKPDGSEEAKIWKSLSSEEISQIAKGDTVELIPAGQNKNGTDKHTIAVIQPAAVATDVDPDGAVSVVSQPEIASERQQDVQTLNQTYEQPATAKPAPSTLGEWSLSQIQEALKRPLPQTMLATRKQGDATLEYIPWHTVSRILDKYAPGWTWQITGIHTTSGSEAFAAENRLFLTGRLTIPTSEGNLYREATGTELLACNGYGDPSSNAESMAFRRCAAKFGLGLYLYERD